MLVPLGAAFVLLPFVSSAAALLLGAALALAFGNPWSSHTKRLQKLLLPASVVGLGAGMDLVLVARTGLRGFGYTLVSITATMLAGLFVAKRLGIRGNTGTLITVGTAICGGSAIAAAAPVVRADDHELTVSLGTVFLLNGIALLVFPPLGHLAGLSQEQFGTWAALAIHDTSSVVGAGLAYGARALEVGTSIKLARALWIVPLVFALARLRPASRDAHAPASPRPWFILGFVVAAALVTYVPALQPAGHVVAAAARRSLVLVLFLIGAGLSASALRQVGVRPLLLGVLLWVAAASVTLAAIAAGLIGA